MKYTYGHVLINHTTGEIIEKLSYAQNFTRAKQGFKNSNAFKLSVNKGEVYSYYCIPILANFDEEGFKQLREKFIKIYRNDKIEKIVR